MNDLAISCIYLAEADRKTRRKSSLTMYLLRAAPVTNNFNITLPSTCIPPTPSSYPPAFKTLAKAQLSDCAESAPDCYTLL